MSVLVSEIRPGAYADSIVLMQLQSDLALQAGVLDVGVVMGTPVNLELLRSAGLLDDRTASVATSDLVIALRAETVEDGERALATVDSLLERDRHELDSAFRPHTLDTALELADSQPVWVAISVPGRYATRLAREALEHHCHVFLYSDNVDLADEVELKRLAGEHGLLLMGPDCGSAIVGGVGFGFTNHVGRGPIGLVCASGTGLQVVTSALDRLGAGVSHAIGTGGRDMTRDVGGRSARQALDLLASDAATSTIVIVSKPPHPAVSRSLLAAAYRIDKPVVLHFPGFSAPAARVGNLWFARDLEEAAAIAADLSTQKQPIAADEKLHPVRGRRFVRGLFSGGTLAQETLRGLTAFLSPVYSNLDDPAAQPLADPTTSRGHTILDLGADAFTVGRLHPMLDQRLRLERMQQEAEDPATALVLLDVVLGRGAHPDPASELVPVIDRLHSAGGPRLVTWVVGSNGDPQDIESTRARLEEAGAVVCRDGRGVLKELLAVAIGKPEEPEPQPDPTCLERPGSIINVGLERFYSDFAAQEVESIQVDWRPPAAGNERIMAILERMKS